MQNHSSACAVGRSTKLINKNHFTKTFHIKKQDSGPRAVSWLRLITL